MVLGRLFRGVVNGRFARVFNSALRDGRYRRHYRRRGIRSNSVFYYEIDILPFRKVQGQKILRVVLEFRYKVVFQEKIGRRKRKPRKVKTVIKIYGRQSQIAARKTF